MDETSNLVELTADIAAAFVSNNKVATTDLPTLIRSIHGALTGAVQPEPARPAEKQEPAVPVKKSITPDYLISLEDGRKYKSLKRHLRTKYDMSPDEYRTKWGLPKDYPMVAPNYSASRSALAKEMGLGAGGRGRAPAEAPAQPAQAEPAPKARGRRKAAA